MRTTKRLMAVALASAMMLSISPVSTHTVQAATATPKLTVSKKYLRVGQSSKMYVKNKVKGATYTFTSSDTKIVTVNKTTGAIKGVKVGTSTIKLTAKVGKKTYTSSAKVIVKEHASSIKIATEGDAVTIKDIGENVYTFTTVMETESGGKCTDYDYFIIPEDTNTAGATITSSGQVSVKNPGSFEVIAVASDSWSMFKKKVYRAQSDPVKVTVPVSMTASMESVNQIKVTSNLSLKSYNKNDFIVMDNGTNQELKISDMELSSADDKTAILTMTNTFNRGTTYLVLTKDSGLSSSFVANYGTIAKIVANESQAVAPNVPTPLDYHLYDENGVDITKLYPHTMAGLEFTFEPSTISLDEYGRVNLPNKNSYAFYTIKYTYLDSTNRRQTITSNTGRITASGSNLKSLEEYSIASNANPDYNNPVHSLAKGETGRRLFCKFESSVGGTIDTAKTSVDNLTYTSSNTNVCGIDRTTGMLYPQNEGTATITVSDGIFSKTVTITVGASRTVNSLVADKTNVTVSSTNGLSNTETVRFELRDQYGDLIKLPSTGTVAYPTVRLISGSDNVVAVNGYYVTRTASSIYTSTTNGYFDLTFYGKSTGSCSVEVNYGGKSSVINVNVKQPGVVSTYKPELSRTTLDPNVQGKNTATLKVYAVDANGIKINTVANGYYSIAYSDGTVIVPSQIISNANGETIDATKLKLKDGTYTLTVTSGPINESIQFTVKASDALINLVSKTTPSTTVSTSDDVVTKILDCFYIYLSGNSTEIPASSLITGSNPLLSDVKVSFTSYDSRYFDSGENVTVGGRDFSKNYIGYTASLRVTKVSFKYLGQVFEFAPDQDITLRVQK